MPIPEPRENESEEDFISRCVSFLVDEGREQDQAVAIAHTQWRKAHASARTLEYVASLHSISSGDEDHLATFYIMNNGKNKNKWGVTDQALEHALPNLLGKPVRCGEGYVSSNHPENLGIDPLNVGKWVEVNKPNGYALGKAEITDDHVWELINTGEWGPVSVVIQSHGGEKCSKCGADITSDPFGHEHVLDGTGYALIDSFTFDTIDFVDHPAYPQAGFMHLGGTEAIEAHARFYAGVSQSTGGNPDDGQGSGSLKPDEKRKKIAMEEKINELTRQVEALTDKLTDVEGENVALKASIKDINDSTHAAHVAKALAARKKAGISADTDAEFLAGLSDSVLTTLEAEATATHERLTKVTAKAGPKIGMPSDDELTAFEASLQAHRKSLFGHEKSLLAEVE